MPFPFLTDFLDRLSADGDLVRVTAEVSRDMELAAVLERLRHVTDSPAVLFESVQGSRIPIVAGVLGTERRLLKALGVASFSETARRIEQVITPAAPHGWMEAMQLLPRLVEAVAWPPRSTSTAPCQQVVHPGSDVDLGLLPVPRFWPGEELPAFTAAHVWLERPQTAEPSIGGDLAASKSPATSDAGGGDESVPAVRRLASRPDIQIQNRQTVLIRWTPHDPEWHVVQAACRNGQPVSVAIVLGGDPALTLAAQIPLPEWIDPLTFAGFLRQKHVTVTRGRTIPIHFPAHAEFVLEGTIDPRKAFADAPSVAASNGCLADPGQAVVMSVSAITHRANPVLPVTLRSAPPGEDACLARAAQCLLLPLIRMAIPELTDIHLPASGGLRHSALLSIRKAYPQHARKVMHAAWGLNFLSTVKLLIVVDDDIDAQNEQAVLSAMTSSVHPGRDVLFAEGPADMFDHAAPIRGVGHRMGIDATRKLPDEGHPRPWPQELRTSDETAQAVSRRWKEYGLPAIDTLTR